MTPYWQYLEYKLDLVQEKGLDKGFRGSKMYSKTIALIKQVQKYKVVSAIEPATTFYLCIL